LLVKCLAELGIFKNKYNSSCSFIGKVVPYGQKFEWEIDLHEMLLQDQMLNSLPLLGEEN
jgi:hypothetical protein